MHESFPLLVPLVVLFFFFAAIVAAIVLAERKSGRKKRQHADAFRAAAEKLLQEPSAALARMLDAGTSVGTAWLNLLVTETQLFKKLKSLSEQQLRDQQTINALAELFSRLGWRLARSNPDEAVAFVAKLFYMNPNDWTSHESALRILYSIQDSLPTDLSEWLYKSCLSLLESNPGGAPCKRLVLEIGRWHYGRLREHGTPTVYDEQAMQNDILVRTK